VALYRTQRALGVGDCLSLGDFAHQNFATLGEGNNGWGGASTFCVCNDDGIAAFKHCNN